MAELLIQNVKISGLPLNLHEGKTLALKSINYLFGSNGSGKTLVLKKITEQAKNALRTNSKDKQGYFAQYITATPQHNFYQDQYQLLDGKASEFDLSNADVSGQAFYQHLEEFPEIKIRVRDALQKYLGRYPNLVRRGINNVMRFLREEDADIPEYSPQQESDGLRRLSLLLTYIYHPKCVFLAIDEPELYLHPDMISFLLEEIHSEINLGKQFAFATHSPEMIKIGNAQTYGYFYFNLKDKLKDSHIIQANEVGAEDVIEKLGYLLDVNRRAFLYAPITVFVEGLADEVVYSKLKEQKKVEWSRRIFMVNTGGNSNTFNFWLLWRKFDKDCRIIFDSPKAGKEKDFEDILNKICSELSIDNKLTLDEKKTQLENHNIFIAKFSDVLIFGDKNIELKDFEGAFSILDISQHIDVLQKAIKTDEPTVKQIRKEEKDWLSEIAKEMFGGLIDSSGKLALDDAITKLKIDHPNLQIEKIKGDEKFLVKVVFPVSRDRYLYIKFPKSTTDTEIGIQ